MCYIKESYRIYYKEIDVTILYVYKNHKIHYSAFNRDEYKSELKSLGLDKDIDDKKHESIKFLFNMMKEENRVPGTRKRIYQSGDIRIVKDPKDIDKIWIFRCSAEKGEPGYSEKRYAVQHYEGGKKIEGMNAWASWYCFNKKDDGMFEAELDEVWWWGGGHNDGGTIRREVPEEWLSLPYDEFLEKVVTLASASYYGFTAETLRNVEGLKAFFGFED